MQLRARPGALTRLVAASAALGAGSAHAELAAERSVSYHASVYDESAVALERVLSGDARRYEIRVQEAEIVEPLPERMQLTVRATREAMSGSSPWFVVPGADGSPRQVMSGATIEDRRRELVATLRREPVTDAADALTVSYSHEDDYTSRALAYARERPLGPRGVFAIGTSYARDRITPTDAAAFQRVRRADRDTLSASASYGLVIDPFRTLQAGLVVTRDRGYLDDPYKLAFVDGALLPDSRPEHRWQSALLVRWRQAFDDPERALHLDYRYARDSWSIAAHTLEAAWYQRLRDAWLASIGLRYHAQGEARFYAPLHDADARVGDRSSDPRLGTFGAISARVGVRREWSRFSLALLYERYRSDPDWALGGADAEVLAPLDWSRVSLDLELRWP